MATPECSTKICMKCQPSYPLTNTFFFLDRSPDSHTPKHVCRACESLRRRNKWAAERANTPPRNLCGCGCGQFCHQRFLAGHNGNRRGIPLTEEHKTKLRVALTGRVITPEARQKLRIAHTGKVLSLDHRAKLSTAHTGKTLSPVHRAQLRAVHLGSTRSADARSAMSRAAVARYADPDARQKMSAALRGKKRSPEIRAQFRETRKRMWQDPDYALRQSQAIIAGSIVKPNRAETSLLTILAPLGFRYVGNGALMIGRKNPDFVDDAQHIVELYGDYWHAGQDPRHRVQYFSQHGWQCLVIWEHELAEALTLTAKVNGWLLA